jgi:hypothetical protein
MKVCPKCGKIVSYNSYFGAYICDNCNWEDCSRTKQGRTIVRSVSKSASHPGKYVASVKMRLVNSGTCK